jgi:TolA-binding protein
VRWLVNLGLLALLVPPAVAAEPAAAESGAPAVDSPDLKAFKETEQRYVERMREYKAEVRSYVAIREADERARVEGVFKEQVTALKLDDRYLRISAGKQFEEFLDKYPNASHSPHVMFRLAELYFEDAEENWTNSYGEYQKALDSADEAALEQLPEEPKKDYRRSMAMYERILKGSPSYEYVDGCYYMLGYCQSEPNSEQYSEEAGLQAFQTLIEKYPKSRFASAAHLRIGEYYFDTNRYPEAIPHYKAVVDAEGRDGKLFDQGLYKLGWSYYKMNEYDQALVLLDQLLVWSSTVYMDRRGRESDMAPEAIEYTAISLSDLADRRDRSPVDVAREFYKKAGDRTFEPKVYKRLADVLTQQARYDDAIAAYREIQVRWPSDPENPTFQYRIASLYMSKPAPEVDNANQAISQLTELYNDDGPWWRANRNNPDALAVARSYIEQSLLAVAAQQHSKAIDTGDRTVYAKAADLYGQYLQKFPFAKDYYEIESYRGDTLLRAGRSEEAEKVFDHLARSSGHNYQEAALWNLLSIRRERITAKYGDDKVVPSDAVVASKEVLPSGAERPIYELGPLHKAFVETADQVMAIDYSLVAKRIKQQIEDSSSPQEKEILERQLEVVNTYDEGLKQNAPAFAYIVAQVDFAHGRFDEARPRLQKVIDLYPERQEAEFSAYLLVDTYTRQEDMANVRKYAERFAKLRLGPRTTPAPEGFSDLAERASFILAQDLMDKQKKYAEAATAFQDFLRDYPKSKYYKDALYDVAYNLERAGKIDEANRWYERYVQENPVDERSRPLLFILAGNYAQSLDLDKAIRYYEDLYKVTRGKGIAYSDAPAALFNAGFLRVGIGDHAGAAKNFEKYARENPMMADAESVMFSAGEQWERVGDSEAVRFYREYVRDYPETNPNHVMEALFRIASTIEKGGKPRDADKAWADLFEAYRRLQPSGRVGNAGRHYAGMSQIREFSAEVDQYKVIKFSADDKKNAELLVGEKKARLIELDARATSIISTFQDFEASSAALYLLGTAYLAYADMLYDAPPPKGFNEDMMAIYREELDKKRLPVEDKGKARLQAVGNLSVEKKRWSEWQVKAQDSLSNKYPSEFAPDKPELHASGDSAVVPIAGPLPVLEKAEPAKAGGAP